MSGKYVLAQLDLFYHLTGKKNLWLGTDALEVSPSENVRDPPKLSSNWCPIKSFLN